MLAIDVSLTSERVNIIIPNLISMLVDYIINQHDTYIVSTVFLCLTFL